MSRVKKSPSARTLRLESLEDRHLLAGDTYLVNFQNDEATIPTRYVRDTGDPFGPRGNSFTYGWTSDHTDQARERSLESDQRFDTLIHFEAGQSWEFALANGDYEVTVAVGDPAFDDGIHTINVEGVNLFNAIPDGTTPMVGSLTVTVSDGRLTLDQGAAAEKATRINYVHIVGLPGPGNTAPDQPTITEPAVDGQIVNPSDVHMEAVGFNDADNDLHKSSDWEIWEVSAPQTIYSNSAEGFVEFRSDGGNWPAVHPDSNGGYYANIGEWFGNDGLTSTVLPFQLPDFGAISNPFTTAQLGVHLYEIGTSTVTNVDLYAVRTDSSPNLLTSDYYSGATIDGSATLIQEDFLTPVSSVSLLAEPNNFTNATGDAALINYLNTAYAGGAGAGDYVFLRLSYASNNAPNGWDAYKITTSEAGGGVGDYPVLSYTTNASVSERVWQTLGIEGVERLHTHLGDGIFEGSHAGRTELLPSTDYELRARFRDDAGSVSTYATRRFTTDVLETISPMLLRDILSSPTPDWVNQSSTPVELPSGAVPSRLRIESSSGTNQMLDIDGSASPGNTQTDYPILASHTSIRVVIEAGTQALSLGASDLTFTGDDQQHTLFLPAISLQAGQRLDLWVDVAGGTYYGNQAQTEPDFSSAARAAALATPYVATQAGFVIEEVGADYRLPVNIAFVPNPGPDPHDPLYFVTELYGSVQVVTRNGAKHEFATSLLDYNPQGPISGSGEQGLSGIAVKRDDVNPDVYHLYVGMLWDNGSPPGGPVHYPKVERLTSAVGGLSMASRSVLLNMQPETQGQSHQISNITIGPDGKLYVHNGDGFDFTTALDLDQYRGKVLRMNLDGTAPSDNPFYNAGDGISARDYVYSYGLRNPFGGAWRALDGEHYQVENGPSVDRFSKAERSVSYGWNGSNLSMGINAIYNWSPATAPVNITFVQPETFAGSQFPTSHQDHAFVSESGPTYAAGPQANGKRISDFTLDANGAMVSGPASLIEYAGTGRSSIAALAAGPDGLYFSSLYEDSGDSGPTASGAKIYRVRYVNPLTGDYDIDGDVDQDDYQVWVDSYGSNLLLAADGNQNGRVDAADYTVWRDALAQFQATQSEQGPVSEAQADAEPLQAAFAVFGTAATHSVQTPTIAARFSNPGNSLHTSREDSLLLASQSGPQPLAAIGPRVLDTHETETANDDYELAFAVFNADWQNLGDGDES